MCRTHNMKIVFKVADKPVSPLYPIFCVGAHDALEISFELVSGKVGAGNTKGGIIIVLLTSCLASLESAVRQLTIFVFIGKTD
jgi:hypothetical protein